jgi:hypothetical protein
MIAGHLDLISPDLIEGWLHVPGTQATLEILAGQDRIGTCTADQPRPDLATAGYGPCAFSFLVPLQIDIADPAALRLRLAGTPLHLLPDADTRRQGFP